MKARLHIKAKESTMPAFRKKNNASTSLDLKELRNLRARGCSVKPVDLLGAVERAGFIRERETKHGVLFRNPEDKGALAYVPRTTDKAGGELSQGYIRDVMRSLGVSSLVSKVPEEVESPTQEGSKEPATGRGRYDFRRYRSAVGSVKDPELQLGLAMDLTTSLRQADEQKNRNALIGLLVRLAGNEALTVEVQEILFATGEHDVVRALAANPRLSEEIQIEILSTGERELRGVIAQTSADLTIQRIVLEEGLKAQNHHRETLITMVAGNPRLQQEISIELKLKYISGQIEDNVLSETVRTRFPNVEEIKRALEAGSGSGIGSIGYSLGEAGGAAETPTQVSAYKTVPRSLLGMPEFMHGLAMAFEDKLKKPIESISASDMNLVRVAWQGEIYSANMNSLTTRLVSFEEFPVSSRLEAKALLISFRDRVEAVHASAEQALNKVMSAEGEKGLRELLVKRLGNLGVNENEMAGSVLETIRKGIGDDAFRNMLIDKLLETGDIGGALSLVIAGVEGKGGVDVRKALLDEVRRRI